MDPNQLDIDPQLLPGAQDRTFQDVIGLQLPSGVMNVPWLALQTKR